MSNSILNQTHLDIKKKVISSWKHLEYVDVSNNRMTKLSGGMLVHAVDLWYVNFSNNKINKLATKGLFNCICDICDSNTRFRFSIQQQQLAA